MRIVIKLSTAIFSWCLLLHGGSNPCLAADVLTMGNGDRLTGEVKSLAGEKVFLKTVYAGTIQIDWLKLEGFSSDRRFEVEVEHGRKYRGKLVLAEGKLEVATAKGTVTLGRDRVVGMAPKAEKEGGSLWREVDGTLDLGYNLTRGHSRLHQSSCWQAQSTTRAITRSLAISLRSSAGTRIPTPPAVRPPGFASTDSSILISFMFALGNFERNDRQRLNYPPFLEAAWVGP